VEGKPSTLCCLQLTLFQSYIMVVNHPNESVEDITMSSATYKIDRFNAKIVEEKGPLPYNGEAGNMFLKEGVVKYYYEPHNPSGVVALVFDTQDNLLGRVQGWHRERLWVEDVEQAFVDTLCTRPDQVVFNYL